MSRSLRGTFRNGVKFVNHQFDTTTSAHSFAKKCIIVQYASGSKLPIPDGWTPLVHISLWYACLSPRSPICARSKPSSISSTPKCNLFALSLFCTCRSAATVLYGEPRRSHSRLPVRTWSRDWHLLVLFVIWPTLSLPSARARTSLWTRFCCSSGYTSAAVRIWAAGISSPHRTFASSPAHSCLRGSCGG